MRAGKEETEGWDPTFGKAIPELIPLDSNTMLRTKKVATSLRKFDLKNQPQHLLKHQRLQNYVLPKVSFGVLHVLFHRR
ncbi:unnamed protein product [Ilex paraguariensis]|uniref:Uncharacterized protein n=1 Tax=Ilex paraguariensis TaxID=185542 RepID=A0ABC8R8U6_9AQUA